MGGIISGNELQQLKQQYLGTVTTGTSNQQLNYPPYTTPNIATPNLPVPSHFGQMPFNPFQRRPILSDFDIELMAICIANKHPQMEGHAGCFCMMKRLEKGISKD